MHNIEWIDIANKVLMLQHFPAAVIKEIFMEPRSYIDLHDTDSGITYQCVFKSRENMTEKFLSRGWLKFAKDKELSKGDVLLFSVEHPPVERILVKVERGQHWKELLIGLHGKHHGKKEGLFLYGRKCITICFENLFDAHLSLLLVLLFDIVGLRLNVQSAYDMLNGMIRN